jgi:hypothetical protein
MNDSSYAERSADEDFRKQIESANRTGDAIVCPECLSAKVNCLDSLVAIQHPFETALLDYRCECGFRFTVAHHGDGSAPEIWQTEAAR